VTTALLLGTLLALVALAYVLYPLFARGAEPSRASAARLAPAVAPEQSAVDVLREIEFDRATGKLSDADYGSLKATYTERALADLRARDSAEALAELPAEDAAEAAISRYRARLGECPSCGPRPEADALYCSDCGRYLPGACPACGTPADAPGARFCGGCGKSLAAA
jgi:hypothetical protein